MKRTFLLAPTLVLAFAATAALAQTAASAPPVSSPAKKALVAKVLALQQPNIEVMARQLTEQPAVQMLQQANTALQRVPAEQREALAKDIQSDARKYAEETTPLVRASAIKLAPTTIGALLEEKFTEDELKQVVALLESPVNRKLQSLAADMQRALAEKLIAETRPTVEPRVRTLQQTIVKRIDGAIAPAAGAAPAASTPKK